MSPEKPLPRYDHRQTYRWNYDHSPDPAQLAVPAISGDWTFAGIPAASPIGVAAGPLLNGRWVLYYASLGFDVLTYKTVRSRVRDCYPLPNLVFVPDTDGLDERCDEMRAMDSGTESWAVSFGMPSSSPEIWRADIEKTRDALPASKRLNVSVVGSTEPGWSLQDLADDYARCARWAVEAGADTVEANLSCPNVDTCDGHLYQQPTEAALVAQTIRDQIGDTPLVLKIGHVTTDDLARELLKDVSPFANALAMTNSIACTVRDRNGAWLFDGQKRGICGKSTLNASLEQVQRFAKLKSVLAVDVKLIGVGGASSGTDVQAYLDCGAESVQLATAAMLDPKVAIKIKQAF